MKKRLFPYSVCFAALVSLMGCTPQKELLKPTGDTATVYMRDNPRFVGELLAVNDRTLYFYVESGLPGSQVPSQERIIGVHVDALNSIKIEGYSNRKWIPALIAFEVIPTVLLDIAAASEDAAAGGFMLVFSIPTAINAAIFAASTPKTPGIEARISSRELEELRKYARFPQGLTPAQLDLLLLVNGQSEMRILK